MSSDTFYWISKKEFIQAFKERYKEEFPSRGLDDRAYFIAGFLEAGDVFERAIENKMNSEQNPERSVATEAQSGNEKPET
jgi:hypothetical protein